MEPFKKIKTIKALKPLKPLDRMQNMKTIKPFGATKWISAHWRFNYATRNWEWILGHWSK